MRRNSGRRSSLDLSKSCPNLAVPMKQNDTTLPRSVSNDTVSPPLHPVFGTEVHNIERPVLHHDGRRVSDLTDEGQRVSDLSLELDSNVKEGSLLHQAHVAYQQALLAEAQENSPGLSPVSVCDETEGAMADSGTELVLSEATSPCHQETGSAAGCQGSSAESSAAQDLVGRCEERMVCGLKILRLVYSQLHKPPLR